MNRTKISKGYYQRGHGKGYIAAPIVYLINGEYYAKHKAGWNVARQPLNGELSGYVKVHPITSPGSGITRYFQD